MHKINYLVVSTIFLIASCAYTPKTISVYDENCEIYVRHMELEAHQLEGIFSCIDEQCISYIVGLGLVTATSAIISGSIVLTGNVVYWFETQNNCKQNQVSGQ